MEGKEFEGVSEALEEIHKNIGVSFKDLTNFAKDMNRHLINNAHKGDSWKRCSLEYLKSKLGEEVTEYLESGDILELIDIANICFFLYKRKEE